MWHDHPFSQRNKTTKIALGVEVGGDGEGGVEQNWKKGGLHKIRGVTNPLHTHTFMVYCYFYNFSLPVVDFENTC